MMDRRHWERYCGGRMSKPRRSLPELASDLPEPPEPPDGDYLAAALRLVHRAFDPADLQIVRLLREDGRMPTREIARRVGLHEGQVRRRVGRLLETGAFRITTLTEPVSLGLLLNAMLLIKCRMDRIEAVSADLASRPEVRYVAFVAGSYDLIVEAFFYSRRHLSVFLTKGLATMDGVLGSETSIVLQVSKLSYEWEIPDLEGGCDLTGPD